MTSQRHPGARGPGPQRGGPARAVGRAARGLSGSHAVHDAGHHRRQREHRCDPVDRPAAGPAHAAVSVVHLPLKGRGRALKQVWSAVAVADRSPTWTSTSRPTSTPCCRWWRRCSRVTATWRSAPGSVAARGWFADHVGRSISRCYNVLLRRTLRARFTDAQCGFKAIRRDVAVRLLPLVRDDAWFFDTEMLVLAERAHLRIHEVPVDWVDDADSRVDIVRTATDDLRGIARLSWSLMRRPRCRSRRYAPSSVGPASPERADRLGAQAAMFVLVGHRVDGRVRRCCTWGCGRSCPRRPRMLSRSSTTTLRQHGGEPPPHLRHRRPRAPVRHQLQGLTVFALGLASTSAALWVFEQIVGTGHAVWEIAS